MLAAVALARPEAAPEAEAEADPYYYHGVVGRVHPTCEHGVDTLEVQTCVPRVDQVCITEDVPSEEITYEKRYVFLKSFTVKHTIPMAILRF